MESYMIVQNAAFCNLCDDFIVSTHRHDMVDCKCGAIYVDGGQEYLRRGGKYEHITDMSWSLEDKIYRECIEAAQHAIETGRNAHGIANAVMRALRKHDRVIADGEHRVMAEYKDELMVIHADDSCSRYKRIAE
jgi:hypothetical protein